MERKYALKKGDSTIETGEEMVKQYIAVFVCGCFGGWLFYLVHIPIPWTLGPLVATGIIQIALKKKVVWPGKIRNAAMVVLGLVMGSPFTPETGQNILAKLPMLAGVTVVTVIVCLLGGILANRFTGTSLATSLLGSMPGGMSQISTICEDLKNIDVAAVTFMQTVRMLTVVSIVPFLALHGFADTASTVSLKKMGGNGDASALILFLGNIYAFIYLAKYLRMPSPYIICPIVGTAILVLGGLNPPALPQSAIAVAQVCVGIRLGMAIDRGSVEGWKKLVFFSWLNIMAVLMVLLGVDYLLVRITATSFVTAFISTAPGGMAEMGLTAMMTGADLSSVVAFQLFRLLFVILVAIPAVRWWLSRYETLDRA